MLTPSKAQKAFPYKPCPDFSSDSHIWLPRLSQNPTERSQEEKVQKCSGGCTDALWKQKRTHTDYGGKSCVLQRLVNHSKAFLLFQISTSPLWQSNYLQKLETLQSLCSIQYLWLKKNVLIPFVCSIFYERKLKCTFKLKGN